LAGYSVNHSVSQAVSESNIKPVLEFSVSPRVDIASFFVSTWHYIVTLRVQATGFRRTVILIFSLVTEVYKARFFKMNFRFSRSITCKSFHHCTRANRDWRKKNFLFIIGVLFFFIRSCDKLKLFRVSKQSGLVSLQDSVAQKKKKKGNEDLKRNQNS